MSDEVNKEESVSDQELAKYAEIPFEGQPHVDDPYGQPFVIGHVQIKGKVLNADNPIKWQEDFLAQYGVTFNIKKSCRIAGISPNTLYKYLRMDPEFRHRFRLAKDGALEELTGGLYERAMYGEKTVTEHYDKNGNLGAKTVTTRPNSALGIRLLEAHRPEIYRPAQRIEHSGQVATGDISHKDEREIMLTRMMQGLLNKGYSVKEALEALSSMGVPPEHLALVKGENLTLPDPTVIEMSGADYRELGEGSEGYSEEESRAMNTVTEDT